MYRKTVVSLLFALSIPCEGFASELAQDSADTVRVFLQGSSSAELMELVESHGGHITHNLHIIDAVGARLSPQSLNIIAESPIVDRIEDDIAQQLDKEDEGDAENEQALCGVLGYLELIQTPSYIEWKLSNQKAEPAKVQGLTLAWPPQIGKVKWMELGTKTIDSELFTNSTPGFVAVQLDPEGAPAIAGTDSLKIGFETTRISDLPQHSFTMEITFDDQCVVSLEPLYDDYQEYVRSGTLVGADLLHKKGITGAGITVAVIDSGLWEAPVLAKNTAGDQRVLARYNALIDAEESAVSDKRGHGTHITSIIANSDSNTRKGEKTGHYKGIAPDVNLVPVKVFGDDGNAHFLDIVRAIQWVLDNKERYDIRVLNISLAARPRWPYWLDPVNQALMRAWASGITVVAAVGNSGPDLMTVGSPGNAPFLITVGAVADPGTADTRDDDYIPDFSSRGPTPSGHVKPDLVAPGANLIGLTRPGSRLSIEQPEFVLENGEMAMTGSSQASALVSGVVALLLQSAPESSPDEVKCMLLTSAEPAVNADGLLSYSPFEQGHGYVSATRAITLGRNFCTDAGNSVEGLGLEAHPTRGPAIVDAAGNPSLPGLDLMLSPIKTEPGLNQKRKWGVEGQVERLDLPSEATAEEKPPYFDWTGQHRPEGANSKTTSDE